MTVGVAALAARVEAQAKLNLYLRVLSREPNGFHQLETLFQRVSLADTVSIRAGVSGRSLDCRGADVGPVERNLAWKAAAAFVAATGWPRGFAIEIEKRIPVGAGLGGGSADAGAVLRALNAMSPTPLGAEALSLIARGLGADVPFLASELTLAVGTGRGERLRSLSPLPAREVLLLIPPFGISSQDAFAWFDVHAGDRFEATPASLPLRLREGWDTVAHLAENDLELPVFARYPEIAALRRALETAGAVVARMTGSGSVVFGVFETPPPLDANSALRHPKLGASAELVSTVDGAAQVELF